MAKPLIYCAYFFNTGGHQINTTAVNTTPNKLRTTITLWQWYDKQSERAFPHMIRLTIQCVLLLCLYQPIYADDDWGDWNQPATEGKTYGVGIEGSDEQLLNALDESSLLDYDNTEAPDENNKKQTPNSDPLVDEAKLQENSEYLFIKSLEEELLEDLDH